MRVVSLRLHNIRSYTDETVSFPLGTIVLAGDIGSGKSTLLQAIEFALFGLLRGELDGASLLRHGEKDGCVELALDIDGKRVIVERSLRRSKDRIEQDTGALVIDGLREPLSAGEIKTRIFSLLGYPSHLVSKHKGLLYRYTIYTPQEEMKAIVRASSDDRLDILRHLFGIDRYQRVRENAQGYGRLLRERVRRLEGETADLPQLLAEMESLSKAEMRCAADELAGKEGLAAASVRVAAARQALAAVEARCKEHDALLLADRTLQLRIVSSSQAVSRLQTDLARADQQLRDLGPPAPVVMEGIDAQLRERVQEAAAIERSVRELTAAAGQAKATILAARSDAARVVGLAECPTCRQGVPDAHKDAISRSADERVSVMEANALSHSLALDGAVGRLEQLRRETDELRQLERIAMAQRERDRQRISLNAHRDSLVADIARSQAEIVTLRDEGQEVAARKKVLESAAAEALQARSALDSVLLVERKAAVAHGALVAELRQLRERIAFVRGRIVGKEEALRSLGGIRGLEGWMSERFVPLVGAMESGALSRIYDAFSGLFSEWFSILVDDAALRARLDDSFTPVVQQEGYDLAFEHLSGGERTACALAYRLALTKAVNDLVSGVRTKGLLILDEPTDGFSAEQLERMRDVLQRLGLGQVIIVTHESLLQGMADRALRVEKRDGLSRVVSLTA